MNFDDILTSIGEFGRFQKRFYFLICLPVIFSAIQIVISVFILAVPKHRCQISGDFNDTYNIRSYDHDRSANKSIPFHIVDGNVVYSKCTVYQTDENTRYDMNFRPENATEIACHQWVYDKEIFQSTVVSKMNLVCTNRMAATHAQMSIMGGFLAGAVILGMLSDITGRKKILYFSYVLQFLTSMATTWAPEIISFSIIRFLSGISVAGIITTTFVIAMELSGPSKRTWAAIGFEFFFAFGMLILAALAYTIRNWQYLQLAVSAPTVLFLLFWRLIPESPRWLLSKGFRHEAELLLKKISVENRRPITQKMLANLKFEETKHVHWWKLFSSRVLAVRTVIIFFNWFVVSMVYYGLSLNSANLGGNVFFNFFLVGVVEIPAYVICVLLLDRIGRKSVYCVGLILGGLACVSTVFTMLYGGKPLQWLTITLATFGKLGAATAFGVLYLISGEVFPTVVRNAAVGTSSCFARVGGIVSPYIASSAKFIPGPFGSVLPSIVFGISAVIAGLLAINIPETINTSLPETLEDGANFGRTNINVTNKMSPLTAPQRDVSRSEYMSVARTEEENQV